MLTTSHDPIAMDAQHVLQVYRRAPVVFESGQGCALFTRDGERYLDLISGVGVASLGHGHQGLARALSEQASTLLHTSNLFHHPLQSELASKLSALSGLPRAFFCNSGAEAVEACLKFARRYWHTQGAKDRVDARGSDGQHWARLSLGWRERMGVEPTARRRTPRHSF